MRLKELREEKNLTQNDIAKAINTSRPNIGRWEKGENEPSSSAVIALAQFFNVSADYLLGLEDDFGIKKSTGTGVSALSKEEQRLVSDFRELNFACKQLVLQTVKTLRPASAKAENVNERESG